MVTRFIDHLLEPDTHANRPAADTVPNGAVYPCTTHSALEQNRAGTWDDDWFVGGASEATAKAEYLVIACSDESTDLASGLAVTFRMPFAMTLTGVRASLTTASASGGPVTVDIKEAGASVLSTKLTIDDTETTSTTGTPAVISDSALADDAQITIHVDDEGTGAKGLKVTLIGTRA